MADLREASSLDGERHAELVLQGSVLFLALCQFLLQLRLPLAVFLLHECNFFGNCLAEI